jgi:hypothetical protein
MAHLIAVPSVAWHSGYSTVVTAGVWTVAGLQEDSHFKTAGHSMVQY